jgi:hypothetical protein
MVLKSCRFLMCLILLAGVAGQSATAGAVSESPGQVWQVGERRWNSAEEQRFARWVESTITEDFFIRHKIAVDCADVPYAIRWIYARIAQLPAAFTIPDGQLMGHWSTNWQELPTSKTWYSDRRFLQSLAFVLGKTSTRTLPKDTYPIRIDTEAVSAGSAFIDDSHSGIIGRIVIDGSTYSPLQTWEATLPRRVMKLRERDYFGSGVDPEEGTGLVRFRWPVSVAGSWRYLPVEKQPWYSLEQYSPDFSNTGESFDRAVARRIDPDGHDPAKGARLIIDSLKRYLLERVKLVRNGFAICQKKQCLEDSILWEEYSTPGRDEVIASQIVHLRRLIRENGLDEHHFKRLMAGIIIPISEERLVTMDYVVDNHLWLSHDPGDSIEARWGLAKCDMIRARIRSALTDLEFTEQRYRRTNPEYADLRREVTLYELSELQAEGRSSGCDDSQQLPRKKSRPPVTLPIRVGW